ncbi:Anaphase-promoting complex subunit 1 [Capsicum baccatum]|uniref:Anaphase-promoting complex subunit 1 n=1 Tax=Capsicum baccatum TaxID=33114 RepID=A0A2G2W6G5_CAPBA|nr:Anaphase-promoting complex subunit 1 [Capsicum baccatum]
MKMVKNTKNTTFELGVLSIGGSPYIHTRKSFSWLSLNPNGQIHLSLISDQYSGVKTLVRRLLCSARPVVIQTPVNPTASDQDLQQAQLWQLAQRTTALPFGRGAFILATTCTLLTEALTVPKLILAGRLPSQQNATVNLDPNVRNVQELKSWPEFHNAVAAGLRLAPPQGKMSRTWILYNKPEEPTVVHAGLLLSLGLHGQLRVLTITDIYQYYSQEHESTTVGLMLGLAASYRGTMQPAISKVRNIFFSIAYSVLFFSPPSVNINC